MADRINELVEEVSEAARMELDGQRAHDWRDVPMMTWRACRICGIVKREDGVPNKPCKGAVRVLPRSGGPAKENEHDR